MIYRKQYYYDKFKCIDVKCPKSCCVGWQIMIDKDSLKKYQNVTHAFADRLNSGINFQESYFYRYNERCSMLNDSGLCDLISTLGEDYLCDTCRLFPRHIEEFQDIREYSLTLACPEVTRIVMEPDYDFSITESEDETFDDPEEFEEFDFLLFDQLEYARDKMFEIASDRQKPLQERMDVIAFMAYKLQECFDEGEIFSMGDVSDSIMEETKDRNLSFKYCMNALDELMNMEATEKSWTDTLINTQKYWNEHDENSKEWTEAMFPDSDIEFIFEKVLKTLLFTYFCGSVYDGQIYASAMIAVQSVRFMMMINKASDEPLNKTIYIYSREIEHSYNNLNAFIRKFEEELD